MKAIIFGAGNIGRGFIAPLFSFDGWNVTFVDVQKPVIDRINKRGQYTLSIVSNKGEKKLTVSNVHAVDGNCPDEAVPEIVDCDIAVTCVGVNAIKYILPNFAAAVKIRYAEKRGPLNLLICENMMNADEYIKELLKERLTEEELEYIGLVETSVGRMVPAPVEKRVSPDPLAISVEEYGVLPVDKAAFKGETINVKNIIPFEPFSYYIERKLFIHNMGHAITAYLGDVFYEDKYIYRSISRPEVKLIAENAMIESAMALHKKYNVPIEPLMQHVWDLLRRFENKALGDTCARVGNDIPRKLGINDRLIGAAKNVESQDGNPVYICLGAGVALYKYCKDNSLTETPEKVLKSLTGLEPSDTVAKRICTFCNLFTKKTTVEKSVEIADEMKKDEVGMII